MLHINSARGRTEGIFAHRDMRLVVPARALSFFGDSIAMVVLALKIAESEQPIRMTVYLIAFSLPMFALAPLAGRLVDEHDSRRLLVGAGSLQVFASLGLVLAPNFAVLIACVLLLQAGQSITAPSWQALVPRIVGDALIGKAIGLQQSLAGLAGLGGAAAAGVMYDVVGYRGTLIIDTSTFAVLAVVGALVKTRRGRRFDVLSADPTVADPRLADDRSGWQFISAEPLLRLLVPALWLFVLSVEATNVVEVFLMRDDIGASAAAYGLVMAAYMTGSIVGPLVAGRIDGDRARVTWSAVAAAVIGVLLVVIGVSSSVVVVMALFAVVGVAGGGLNALLGALLVTRSPDHVRGRVLATLSGTTRGFAVVAMVLGGVSGQLVGARATFVICGALAGLVALVVLQTRRAAAATVSPDAPVAATMEA